MTNILISGGLLTIGTASFNAGDYAAEVTGNSVVIVHKNNPKNRVTEADFDKLKLNGQAYGSAKLFAVAFNVVAAGSLNSNTDYTDTPFSSVLTPAQETHVCNQAKKGYFILSAPDTNTGLILYGPVGLSAANAGLAPGQSVVIESGDLSKWFVKNVTGTDKVNVAGEYKN